ncbi:helix-turn-helix domain-containing protein [Patescibacteria group bacterium]|nr:helix-turn-helix domain-containing protein [Patescibacteria group bacterium]MBU1448933.1 helix-turn-helix domain-containing protein [Patescibacteria group bacterium]MBU2613154.1 helix-turn-helix domain-containing protein [Patescibacteria group bacterium]
MPFMQVNVGGVGFGPALRQLRELRGLSREELAELTKIHLSVIAAFEEERLTDIIDPTHAERHVRALLVPLEGRPAYFLPKYRELLERKGIDATHSMTAPHAVRRRDFFVTSQAIALVGFLALVTLAAGYLIWQARIIQEPPPLTVLTPVEGARLADPRVDVLGKTAPGALVSVNGQPAVVSADGVFTLSFDVPRGLTTLTIVAKRRYGSSATDARSVTYDHVPAPARPVTPIVPTSTSATGTK